MSLRSTIANLVANLIDPSRAAAPRSSHSLAVRETEDTITKGTPHEGYERENVDRLTIIDQAIKARKANPIAKRICELQTEFAVGDGLGIQSDQAQTLAFAKGIWDHPLNDLDSQIPEFADEAWTTGDLFVVGTVDLQTAETYYRVLPAEMVVEIETASNDYRQEKAYKSSGLETPYLAYDSNANYIEEGKNVFVLHFPHNRIAGQCFGSSDYDTILYWLRLYKQFIEDRARKNFFSQLFTWVVQKTFGSWADKDKYIQDFAARMPKKSGGVMAVDQDEVVGTINPNLASFEASEDGLLLLRMVAIGVGFPLHWFGIAESNTRTTAEAAGTPAFRRLKNRQKLIVHAVTRMIAVALEIKKKADPKALPEKPAFNITSPDLTERDNDKLALAVLRLVQALSPLYNAKKISAKELMRLIYRFLAEAQPDDEQPDPDEPVIIGGKGSTTDPTPPEEPA